MRGLFLLWRIDAKSTDKFRVGMESFFIYVTATLIGLNSKKIILLPISFQKKARSVLPRAYFISNLFCAVDLIIFSPRAPISFTAYSAPNLGFFIVFSAPRSHHFPRPLPRAADFLSFFPLRALCKRAECGARRKALLAGKFLLDFFERLVFCHRKF